MNINEPKRGGFVLPFFNTDRTDRKSTRASSIKSNRLPFLGSLPDNVRNHFVATSAEYAGTTLFLFFAFSGTQVALLSSQTSSPNVVGAVSDPSSLMYIALSFGFSLAVNAWVFFRISGGLFNPAVTLGMCLVGALPYIRGLCLFVAQVLGGITAAAICSALFPGPLTVRTNLGGGTSVVQGLFIEMFLTAELVFTIFMLAAEKHKGTFIAPVGIGLSLFVAELTGVYFTGGSVNPARSFGPSVVSHQFHTYHWIYWVGPILGSLLASGFYLFIKMLEYETANPGQDRSKNEVVDDDEGEHFNPDLDTSHPRVSFAPEDYAKFGGDANGIVGGGDLEMRNVVGGGGGGGGGGDGSARDGKHGEPREYGTGRRPFSDSPAPPHANDQFAGLAEGGMHADEQVSRRNPSYSVGGDSDRTVVVPMTGGGNMVVSPTSTAGTMVGSSNGGGGGTSVGQKEVKSAMRQGRGNGMVGVVRDGTERSARHNTQVNRNMVQHGGLPSDEEFFDDEK